MSAWTLLTMLICKSRLEVTPGFLLLLGGMFYLDQGVGILPWALLSCLIHEAGHVAAAYALKGRLNRLSLSVIGAELSFEYPKVLSYGAESLVALAGPAANLLAGAAAYQMRAFLPAVLCLGIGGFNLFPILPLDGGRILQNLLMSHLESPWPERILTVASGVLTGILMGVGAVVAAEYANVTLLLTAGWLLVGNLKKEGKNHK